MAQLSVTMLLLAGGRARRFGSDKRFALEDGEPLVARVYRVAASVAPTWVLIANPADAALLERHLPGARFITDSSPGSGPLAALAVALAKITTPAAVLVAADLADIDQPLLACLAEAAVDGRHVVVCDDGGTLQVACAAYPRTAAAAAQRAVDEGERSLTGWVRRLQHENAGLVNVIPAETWRTWTTAAQPFRNINVPADLEGY